MAKAGRRDRAGNEASDDWGYLHAPISGFEEASRSDAYFHLPAASTDRLKERGFTNDEIYGIVAPRRTLARRKELGQELTAEESDRVLRLARMADMADRVFDDHEKAQRWLRKANRVLDGMRPIDLLATETGSRIVEEELHRIDHGIFA